MLKKKKSGFTLIEIIISLVVTIIVLEIVYSIFITGNKVFSDSDVKTTLQMEGQSIQEKISNIGMQAVEIKSISKDNNSNELESIIISSYDKSGNSHDFVLAIDDTGNIYKDNSKIYRFLIDNEEICNKIKSFKIYTNSTSLNNINSLKFDITLRKESGYSNVEQAINFGITFRNK